MKDFLGREVNPGDYFAYPLIVGRSASMGLYQMVAVVEGKDIWSSTNVTLKVKARKINASYGFNNEWKYKKWDSDAGYVDMTEAEKAKVAAKLSTLSLFSERACKIEYAENE